MSIRGSFGRSTTASRAWAVAGTVAYHAIFIMLLLLLVMDFNRSSRQMKEELEMKADSLSREEPEVLLAGEYVTLGDDALLAADNTLPETAPPAPAAEPAAGASSLVTTTAPQPVKAAPPRTDPREQEERRRRQEEQKRLEEQREQAKTISERVNFQGPVQGQGATVRPGAADGNSSAPSAKLAGKPGTSLKGRTLAHWASPRAAAEGSITVQVRVNRQGQVIAASYLSGTGTVQGDMKARTSCLGAAKASSFSVSDDAPAEQVGTITYKFTPPSSAK